jgi:endonuclease/exonuclease/phosphatase family metal-dependent hydrolase
VKVKPAWIGWSVWGWGLLSFSVSAETWKIATYNLANYNLTDRQIEGAFLTQYPKPEHEKTALRRVIRLLNADVLALQEIGGELFVRELQRDLKGEGVDYPYSAVLSAGDGARKVAVLSRHPFTKVGRHDDLDFSYFEGREVVKRGMLEVRFATEAGELALFVVHFKSRWTERRDDPEAEIRRGREATAARDRVLELFPQPELGRFVVAGDFNDGPTDRVVRAFTHRGDLRLSYLLPVEDSRGETWTHLYRRNHVYSRVDHIMVSQPLRDAVMDGKGLIYDRPGVLVASDHRPVLVEFQWTADGGGSAVPD